MKHNGIPFISSSLYTTIQPLFLCQFQSVLFLNGNSQLDLVFNISFIVIIFDKLLACIAKSIASKKLS
jgi:hypothetical protein